MKIDLHMHSNISNDGEFSPKELVEMCNSAEINVMALADHNSVRGVKEAAEHGKEKNIKNFWKNDSVGEFFSILYIPSKRDVLSLAHCRLWY